jgi:tetratricopeptide (TPR) repeat protein
VTARSLAGLAARFTGALLALGLYACDTGTVAEVDNDKPSEALKTFLETPVQQARQSGAHNQSDPHASLSAQQMAQVALQHYDESRVQLAFETLNAAIGKYPENAMLLSLRASLYLQEQQTSPALADFNRAIELNSDDPVLLTNRAQALRQFGRSEEARRDLDSAIELDQQFIAAFFNRGSLYLEAEKYNLALADFNRCIELRPDLPAAYFNRASTFKAMGEHERAIGDLKHFLTLSPEESWAQVARDILSQWNSDQS